MIVATNINSGDTKAFDSVTHAAEYLKLNPNEIEKILTGRSAYIYSWTFHTNETKELK